MRPLNLDCAAVCGATGSIMRRSNKAGHHQLLEAHVPTASRSAARVRMNATRTATCTSIVRSAPDMSRLSESLQRDAGSDADVSITVGLNTPSRRPLVLVEKVTKRLMFNCDCEGRKASKGAHISRAIRVAAVNRRAPWPPTDQNDNARKSAVRKRTQLKASSGQDHEDQRRDVKEEPAKLKGVRREKKKAAQPFQSRF